MFRFLRWVPVFALALVLAACSPKTNVPTPQSQPQLYEAKEYGYPPDYEIKSTIDQVSILRRIFPELAVNVGVPGIGFPLEAEGYFAIPQWQTIAPTYGEAVERVFAELAKQRPFYNWLEGKLGPENLRQTEQTAAAWKQLAESQNNSGILLVPAQFGLRYGGKSVKEARASFTENEFGLGAYAVGIMLLTHPERLGTANDLWIDAAGDEHSYKAGGTFSHAPLFSFSDGEVEFRGNWFDLANGRYGSASAFLSQ